ncbi:MAG: PAS domain-containing protein [Cytophagales bacterium]|nr:PAS domain-containing protein [Bernardetiaceae bacterium]MDW8205785.1 PAS domain-containing protein [Cytophagales bacterium]
MHQPIPLPPSFSSFAAIAMAMAVALIICLLWLLGEPLLPAWSIPLTAVAGALVVGGVLWRQFQAINTHVQQQQHEWQQLYQATAQTFEHRISILQSQSQQLEETLRMVYTKLAAASVLQNLPEQLQQLTAQAAAAFEVWILQADGLQWLGGTTTRTYDKLPVIAPQTLWHWLEQQPKGFTWHSPAETFPEQVQHFQAAVVLPYQIAEGKLLAWQLSSGEKGFFLLEKVADELLVDACLQLVHMALEQHFTQEQAQKNATKIGEQAAQIATLKEQLRQKEATMQQLQQKEATIQQLQQLIGDTRTELHAQKNKYKLLQDEYALIYEGAPGGLAYFTADEPIGLFYETDTQVRLLHQRLKLKFCNRQFARQWGQEQPQQMESTRFETLFPNPNGRDTMAVLGHMLKNGHFAEETLEQDRDGNLYRCYKQYRAVKAENHLLGVLVAHLRFAKLSPDVSQAALHERQLRAWVTRQPVLSALADVSGNVKELSLMLETFTGLQKGQNLFSLIHPEDLAEVQQQYYAGAAALDSIRTFAARFRNRENQWREGNFVLQNANDESVGGGMIIAIWDATHANEQQRSQQARIALLTATLDSIADPIAAIDAKHTFLYANPAMKALAGNNHLPIEALAQPPEIAAHLLYKGGKAEIRWRNQALQQTQRMETQVVKLPMNAAGGHTVIHLHDVTRSREQAERLQLQLNKFSEIAMQTQAAIALCAPDGEIRWANAAFRQVLGFAENQKINLLQLADDESDTHPQALLEEIISQPEQTLCAAFSFINAKGKKCWGEWTFRNLVRREAIGAVLITLHECTGAKMHAEKLARHYRHTQALLNLTRQAIVLTDKEGYALLWTAAADFLQLREGQRIQRLHEADFWEIENGQTFRHRHTRAGEYATADVENITPLIALREALEESIIAEKAQVQHTCDVIARFEAIIADMQTRMDALAHTTDLAMQTAVSGAQAIAEARALLPEIASASNLLPVLQHAIQDWAALLERYEEIGETTDIVAKLLEINAFRTTVSGDELPEKTQQLIGSLAEKLGAIHQVINHLQRLEPALK